ncbi:MAG: 3'-5' exoribonuclease [Burkholderiaceae bacterium]|nr:3'-5' exoribonuclease [Burkholderiaceae bacterium]
MRIFFDTEFTDLISDCMLISIGFVDETGDRSFYAELSDTWRANDLGDFAAQSVVPLLDGQASLMSMAELRERLTGWFAGFDGPVRLATDSLAWDWRWMQEIFPSPETWPVNVEKIPLLLTMNYLQNYDEFELAVESAFSSGLRRHHALDDARANRFGWLASGGDVD